MDPSRPDWVAIGGWPRIARTIFSRVVSGFALALIDTNADGRELCLDCLSADEAGQWQVIASGTDVDPAGYPGWTPTFVYSWGRIEPHESIAVTYRDKLTTVRADDYGWWAFICPTDPSAGDQITPS